MTVLSWTGLFLSLFSCEGLKGCVVIIYLDFDYDHSRCLNFKYVGLYLRLSHNKWALYNKRESRLYLLWRLRSFGAQGPLLRTFYDYSRLNFLKWSAGAAESLLGTEMPLLH